MNFYLSLLSTILLFLFSICYWTTDNNIMLNDVSIMFVFRENDRLKEQLRHYMSAVEIAKALKSENVDNTEVDQYEKKLVQVLYHTRY